MKGSLKRQVFYCALLDLSYLIEKDVPVTKEKLEKIAKRRGMAKSEIAELKQMASKMHSFLSGKERLSESKRNDVIEEILNPGNKKKESLEEKDNFQKAVSYMQSMKVDSLQSRNTIKRIANRFCLKAEEEREFACLAKDIIEKEREKEAVNEKEKNVDDFIERLVAHHRNNPKMIDFLIKEEAAKRGIPLDEFKSSVIDYLVRLKQNNA